MTQTTESSPSWAVPGMEPPPHLAGLLTFALDGYSRQTDWFLRHRDTGIRNLGTVITAEFAVLGLGFTPAAKTAGASGWLFVLPLAFLVLAAVALWLSALVSCRRSYRAALEHTMLMAKVAWALGFTARVPVDEAVMASERPCPAARDPFVYVPRYAEGTASCATTEAFVREHLRSRRNTYFWAEVVLYVFGIGAVILGAFGMFAVTQRGL